MTTEQNIVIGETESIGIIVPPENPPAKKGLIPGLPLLGFALISVALFVFSIKFNKGTKTLEQRFSELNTSVAAYRTTDQKSRTQYFGNGQIQISTPQNSSLISDVSRNSKQDSSAIKGPNGSVKTLPPNTMTLSRTSLTFSNKFNFSERVIVGGGSPSFNTSINALNGSPTMSMLNIEDPAYRFMPIHITNGELEINAIIFDYKNKRVGSILNNYIDLDTDYPGRANADSSAVEVVDDAGNVVFQLSISGFNGVPTVIFNGYIAKPDLKSVVIVSSNTQHISSVTSNEQIAQEIKFAGIKKIFQYDDRLGIGPAHRAK